jgi:hypothetical protein
MNVNIASKKLGGLNLRAASTTSLVIDIKIIRHTASNVGNHIIAGAAIIVP